MNIHGSNGIINSDGLPGSSSELFDCRSEGFLYNIEDGIRSTVIVALIKGLLTLSSCQGHDNSCPYRCISIIGNREHIRFLQLAIHQINAINKQYSPITYYLLPYHEECGLYVGELKAPIVIDILFGDIRDSDTIIKQTSFEEYLLKNEIVAIDYELPEQYVTPYIRSGDHIDVFYSDAT